MEKLIIVGGGLVGSMAACMLARGFEVELFEKRPDIRSSEAEGGRSINLILTKRGLDALESVGLREKALACSVPVYGRMMHDQKGDLSYQPYGGDQSLCNYSIGRSAINRLLLGRAEELGVRLRFGCELSDIDFEAKRLTFNDGHEVSADVLLGADGSGSAVRAIANAHEPLGVDVSWLSHGYKELKIPAAIAQQYKLAPHALHIWPRGHLMMMALPNEDGSFTVTIYLAHEPQSKEEPKASANFHSIQSDSDISTLFATYFPDAINLIPDYIDAFQQNPAGSLGTVRCERWVFGEFGTLLGDAAHAIVPFFGQGMNCGFEDCTVLAECLAKKLPISDRLEAFAHLRKPNADAIAQMSLENFVEMSEKVADPRFLLKKSIEHHLEHLFPDRFRSRYGLVCYTNIPYRDAFELGQKRDQVISQIASRISSIDELDVDEAMRLLES